MVIRMNPNQKHIGSIDQKQNPNANRLLEMVGKKLGKDPKMLQQQLEAGKYDSVLGNLNSADSQKLQTLLNNPKLAQQMINTPQAQKMLKKLFGE